MQVLSDEEITVVNQTAEFDSAIGYARKIEAAVLGKVMPLCDQLGETLDEAVTYCEGPQWSPSMAEECHKALAAWREMREAE